MSLAAMKLKLKHTKGVKVGYKPHWASTRSNCARACGANIKDSKPSISYEQYTNNLRLGKQSKRGDCCNEIVLDHHKKPSFADKSAEHRIEILTTHHLKDENVEKLKHQHKVALDGCRDHALNILGDDSNMVRTAEHVLKKRKACLIGKPSEIKTVDNVKGIEDNSLFFVVTGRGSILANMNVEVSVKLNTNDDLIKLDFKAGSGNTTDKVGIASVEIDLKSDGKPIEENDITYYILKLVPSDDPLKPSVNTQQTGRETKIKLDYYAKIDPSQMNAADTSDGLQIAGGDDAGVADFEITPITNLIYTLFSIVGVEGLTTSIRAILGQDITEAKLKLGANGQGADLEIDSKKRIAMFDIILKKAKVMEYGTDGQSYFWKESNGDIKEKNGDLKVLLTDIGSTPLDKYILDLDSTSPIASSIHNELQTIYHILNKSADKLKPKDIEYDETGVWTIDWGKGALSTQVSISGGSWDFGVVTYQLLDTTPISFVWPDGTQQTLVKFDGTTATWEADHDDYPTILWTQPGRLWDDDDWDDVTNTISQIVINGSYKHNGETKTKIYDETVSASIVPRTNIFDVSTDFGFLDHDAGGGAGATNVDYFWD